MSILTFNRSCASLALALTIGAIAARAQAPVPGLPAQQQGFETTGQNPANYSAEEKAAVAAVTKWIEATNTKDNAALMAMVDENIVYRGDPSEYLGRSARGFCANYGFVRNGAWVRLDEIYVIGGPLDTLVLFRRVDSNGAPGRGGFGGYQVDVGVFARVRNGKITEWLDEPVNNTGRNVAQIPVVASRPPQADQRVPAICMQYPATGGTLQEATGPGRGGPSAPHPAAPTTLGNGIFSYGTQKLESRFKVDEALAVRTVRGWLAAWSAGNPKLLGSFVDKSVFFRATPTGDLVGGRDALLKTACTMMGGPVDLTDIYVIGGEWDALLIARWNKIGAGGQVTKMGSFFRVQKGLIVEWMDSTLDGTPTVANPNSAACQTVNTTLAAFAPLGPPVAPGR